MLLSLLHLCVWLRFARLFFQMHFGIIFELGSKKIHTGRIATGNVSACLLLHIWNKPIGNLSASVLFDTGRISTGNVSECLLLHIWTQT